MVSNPEPERGPPREDPRIRALVAAVVVVFALIGVVAIRSGVGPSVLVAAMALTLLALAVAERIVRRRRLGPGVGRHGGGLHRHPWARVVLAAPLGLGATLLVDGLVSSHIVQALALVPALVLALAHTVAGAAAFEERSAGWMVVVAGVLPLAAAPVGALPVGWGVLWLLGAAIVTARLARGASRGSDDRGKELGALGASLGALPPWERRRIERAAVHGVSLRELCRGGVAAPSPGVALPAFTQAEWALMREACEGAPYHPTALRGFWADIGLAGRRGGLARRWGVELKPLVARLKALEPPQTAELVARLRAA